MIAVFASAGLSDVVASLAEVVAERAAGSRRRFERDLLGSRGACGTGMGTVWCARNNASGDGRFIGP